MTAPSVPATKRPIDTLLAKCGGQASLAALLDVPHSTVYRWAISRSGLIPSRWHAAILSATKARGIRVSFKDLVQGS